MRNFYFIMCICTIAIAQEKPDEVLYQFPLANSEYVSRTSTILLRFQKNIIVQDHHIDNMFTVRGERYGEYPINVLFSDDRETVLCHPTGPFIPGEEITVTITSELLSAGRYEYKFFVTDRTWAAQHKPPAGNGRMDTDGGSSVPETVGRVTTINGVGVPSDFPNVSVIVNKAGKAPGRLFFGFRRSYFMILENDGTPYYYQKSNDFLMDFKVLPNGLLSRTVDDWDAGKKYYVTMDHHFENADTFRIEHGYIVDHHDFQLLDNGHHLIMGNDHQTIDMSKIVSGGKRNANVLGHILQELDSNHNVVFEWRGWDHLPITDSYENIRDQSFDYAHMNSISLDFDGHYLISCRNLSQCIKINRHTGDIIWILGGKRSSFEFLHGDEGNSYQHMFRAVPGKPNHYTLFDNGNTHDPPYSRGVEFKIDTTRYTAENVWEFQHKTKIRAGWLGSVQRLPNGNTLIDWSGHGTPFATEVTPDGNTVYEAKGRNNMAVYRTYRFDWEGNALRPYLILDSKPNNLTLVFNKFGDKDVRFYRVYSGFSPDNMEFLAATQTPYYNVPELLNNRRHYFMVTAVSSDGTESGPSNVEDIFVYSPAPGENITRNGDFAENTAYWSVFMTGSAQARGEVVDGVFYFDIEKPGPNFYNIQLMQHDIPLYKNEKYVFEFDAWAETPRAIDVKVEKSTGPFTNYGRIGPTQVTTRKKRYQYKFTMRDNTDVAARIVINCGKDKGDVFVDNVSLKIDSPDRVESAVTCSEPDKVRLARNYPNPFNPQTRIDFYCPAAGHVTFEVFDVTGRKVATLLDEQRPAGWHDIVFKGGGFAGGVYYYRLRSGDQIQIKKMCLIK